ncbi:hypothetical protein ACFXG6_15445 [Streptomyces roseus]|uniref:hypothetical protein n=1 Tax=Streptomyces roseus TaxID=66430 RepID=UPI0036D1FA6F
MVWLSSDKARLLTGIALPVDGGYTVPQTRPAPRDLVIDNVTPGRAARQPFSLRAQRRRGRHDGGGEVALP